ncbi:MAG: O-antigen ligase family protein [Bdellovibrionales bacterium]|nr:O-antigen ligase family protein [Bdellovibrionales bacterium]
MSIRTPLAEKLILISLAIFCFMTLGSMATMSIGTAFLILPFVAMKRTKVFGSAPAGFSVSEGTVGQYLRITAALVSALAFSLVVAKNWPLSYSGKISEVQFADDLKKVWHLFIPPIVAYCFVLVPETSRRKIGVAYGVVFLIFSVIGFQQFFTGWPRPQGVPEWPGRFHSTIFLGHHLSLASIWIFPWFVALELAFSGKESLRVRAFAWACVVFGGASLFFSLSRMLWVALPVGIALWTVLRLPGKLRIAAVAALVLIAGVATQIPAISLRLNSHIGAGTRVELWKANWEFFKARPWTGVGFRHTQEMSGLYLMEKFNSQDVFSGHAHNNFLEMLGGSGILGTLAWLAWCFFWFQQSYVLLQTKSSKVLFGLGPSAWGRALLAVGVVFQLNGLTQVNFWEAKVMHSLTFFMGLLLAARVEFRK